MEPDMVNGSLCNLFTLAFLLASFSLLHRADETQSVRNSCPRLQPYVIGFCRVGVSQSLLFYVFVISPCSLLYVCLFFGRLGLLQILHASSIIVCGPLQILFLLSHVGLPAYVYPSGGK